MNKSRNDVRNSIGGKQNKTLEIFVLKSSFLSFISRLKEKLYSMKLYVDLKIREISSLKLIIICFYNHKKEKSLVYKNICSQIIYWGIRIKPLSAVKKLVTQTLFHKKLNPFKNPR